MQHRATRQSRSANAEEKRFHAYTKEADCICCGMPGPSIVDHCVGSSFKIKHGLVSVLVGHWFCIPLCIECDSVTTKGSKRAFREAFGSQAELWLKHVDNSPLEPPGEVRADIEAWGR